MKYEELFNRIIMEMKISTIRLNIKLDISDFNLPLKIINYKGNVYFVVQPSYHYSNDLYSCLCITYNDLMLYIHLLNISKFLLRDYNIIKDEKIIKFLLHLYELINVLSIKQSNYMRLLCDISLIKGNFLRHQHLEDINENDRIKINKIIKQYNSNVDKHINFIKSQIF